MSGHMLIPLSLLYPTIRTQSHSSLFNPTFPLLNPTIIISIPLFAHQSHFFGRIFIIPLLLFSYILVRRDLQHYQHNDDYQQCLGKAQKHIQGHDCIEATQFGIRCQCSGLTHTVHILVFGKVLQSTSCSRYWPEGC